MLKKINITTGSIEYAWFEALYATVDAGRCFTIDKGSFEKQQRLELDYITVHIPHPWTMPMLPQLNPAYGIPDPVDIHYPDDYVQYIMTDAKKPGEAYTYGQRICAGFMTDGDFYRFKKKNDILLNPSIFEEVWARGIIREHTHGWIVNQMEMMIYMYKNHGHRNNQMILQVGSPGDMLLQDPPCLRHIDTRLQDGALHFFPYFRSWDLWGGFPANLAVIELMKQYCAGQIGVKNGEIIAASKGLHLYGYTWELAQAVRGLSLEEFIHDASKGGRKDTD